MNTTKSQSERIASELEAIGRTGEVMLEMYAARCDEHHDKYRNNPLHFFEWIAPTAWADSIILENLKFLKSAWDEKRDHVDDHAKLRSIGQIILMFAVKRAERKIETSTYAAREMQSIAFEDAYAKLCSMFTNAHTYFRDNEPAIYDDYLKQINRAIVRGY